MNDCVQWKNIRNLSAIEDQEWHDLVVESPSTQPMMAPSWVRAYADTLLPASADMYCGLAYEAGRLVAALPLVCDASARHLFSLDKVSTPYHEHMANGDLTLSPDCSLELVSLLLDSLESELGIRVGEIALRGVIASSKTAHAMKSSQHRFIVVEHYRSKGSYLPIGDDRDTYFRSLSKNFRSGLRKARNRLQASETKRISHQWLTDAQALPEYLETFLNLEASGWKGREGSAIACDNSLTNFYVHLASNAYEKRILEWHFLSFDDEPVAAHLAVRMGTKLTLIKIAYDESYARFSPGSLLFEDLVEKVYREGGTSEIDCLTDMDWHRRWLMPQRRYTDIRLFPKTLRAGSFHLLPRLAVNTGKRLRDRTAEKPAFRMGLPGDQETKFEK